MKIDENLNKWTYQEFEERIAQVKIRTKWWRSFLFFWATACFILINYFLFSQKQNSNAIDKYSIVKDHFIWFGLVAIAVICAVLFMACPVCGKFIYLQSSIYWLK